MHVTKKQKTKNKEVLKFALGKEISWQKTEKYTCVRALWHGQMQGSSYLL